MAARAMNALNRPSGVDISRGAVPVVRRRFDDLIAHPIGNGAG